MGLLVVLVLAVLIGLAVTLPRRLLARRAGSLHSLPVGEAPVSAPAVVQRLSDEGAAVRLLLAVEPDAGDPFTVELTQMVSPRQRPAVQPGHVVEVRYQPDDPGRAVLINLGP